MHCARWTGEPEPDLALADARWAQLEALRRSSGPFAEGHGYAPAPGASSPAGAAPILRRTSPRPPPPSTRSSCHWPASDARLRAAEALIETGDREGASCAARGAWLGRRCRSAAARPGCELLARRARIDLARHQVLEASTGGNASPLAELGHTPREVEVLALVAEGRTNREIGAASFMSEKTASVHVSRILAKLGVRSRVDAAGVAYRLGLRATERA